MTPPILATKLYIPPTPPRIVHRPRLLARLNAGLPSGITLISASAGFGKTTLVSTWLADDPRPAAWISLGDDDNDLPRFLAYLVAALQTIAPTVGETLLPALQSPQPPAIEAVLTALLNDIAALEENFLLILDDYHVIETPAIDEALTFLLEHLPPQMHLVIATREDPPLPLSRFRVRGQLIELRAVDLRFTADEAAQFLNQAMGLNLSAENIAALETRTEGWIAGLQLAALSMRGDPDITGFIRSFTGSHRFVLDYLVEEVLHQQPEAVQTFLLRTAVLDRLCGPLCDALLADSAATSQQTLEYIEQANLFIIPLDSERRWYRYHHLFAELLRQRLQHSGDDLTVLHLRASGWYEENGLEVEAFQHAAAAQDIKRAMRLAEGNGMPLHFRGAVTPVLNWLTSLPEEVLNAEPTLWVMYASALTVSGQNTRVEAMLQAAEAALEGREMDADIRNLIGHIAAIRALLAATQYQIETIITQSRRALEYLHPDNLPVRTATTWKLGLAYQFQGERQAAREAYLEAIAICQASGNVFIEVLAATGLGIIQERDTELHQAVETYQRVLALVGEPPKPAACEAFLGLARITYQWNDLAAAEQHGQQSLRLARQIEMIDSFVESELFLARVRLAQDDAAGAATMLAQAEQSVQQHNFVQQIPALAAMRVQLLRYQGDLTAAAVLAQQHALPFSQARVHLAQGDPALALAILTPVRAQAERKAWPDQQLQAMILQALAYHARGDEAKALQHLADALALAEMGGYIRIFVDEGAPMALLLAAAATRGIRPQYARELLAAFPAMDDTSAQPLIEPLSERELEILGLVAQGLSNREISERLVLALSTVKGHNRNIYGKLQVQRRTEAVARARELGLL